MQVTAPKPLTNVSASAAGRLISTSSLKFARRLGEVVSLADITGGDDNAHVERVNSGGKPGLIVIFSRELFELQLTS